MAPPNDPAPPPETICVSPAAEGQRLAEFVYVDTVVLCALIGWTFFCILLGWISLREDRKDTLRVLSMQAEMLVDNDIRRMRDGGLHGRIYGPADPDLESDPYLRRFPDRVITTPSGRRLSLLPFDQLMDGSFAPHDAMPLFRSRLVCLKSLRHRGRPDPWERDSLGAFARGVAYAARTEPGPQGERFRFMKPLRADATCMECHSQPAFSEGSVAGGVSVSLPVGSPSLGHRRHRNKQAGAFAAAWLFGELLLLAGWYEIRRRARIVHESERRSRRIMDSIGLGIALVDPSMRILFANRQMLRWFPSLLSEREGRCSICRDCPVRGTFRDGKVHETVTAVPSPEGTRHYRVVSSPILDASGDVLFCVKVGEDITARREADLRLQAALNEKDVLLFEVHHRVKNNLQSIIHLLDMRLPMVGDAATAQFMKELQGQARTMALVYEQLYRSKILSRVKMSTYLKTLTDNILLSFGREGAISLHVDAEGESLDVTQAMPCGLAVNELVTNALKHAFPAESRPSGAIQVAFHVHGERAILRVADDGVGLPPELDVKRADSLGLKLVCLWAEHQLGGNLTITSGKGTSFVLDFPLVRRTETKTDAVAGDPVID